MSTVEQNRRKFEKLCSVPSMAAETQIFNRHSNFSSQAATIFFSQILPIFSPKSPEILIQTFSISVGKAQL